MKAEAARLGAGQDPISTLRGGSVDLEEAKREIRAAYENRAALYYFIFNEMRCELGEEKAVEIMSRAIHKRGVEHGKQKYGAAAAARDFAAIGEMFVAGSACDGELFEPGVDEVRADGVVLTMKACPLVDAWRELGLSDADVDTMCAVASAVDVGTYEGIGLAFGFRERLGEADGARCVLDIRSPE